jgi:hypothetical protein
MHLNEKYNEVHTGKHLPGKFLIQNKEMLYRHLPDKLLIQNGLNQWSNPFFVALLHNTPLERSRKTRWDSNLMEHINCWTMPMT